MPSLSIGDGISCLAVVKLMVEECMQNFVVGRLFGHILTSARARKLVYKLRSYMFAKATSLGTILEVCTHSSCCLCRSQATAALLALPPEGSTNYNVVLLYP